MKSSEFIPIIANKHQVSEDAVKKDWSNRPNWIKYFMNVEDTEKLAYGILEEYETTRLDAVNLYEQADEIKIKTQLLWLRLKITDRKYDYIKEIGVLQYLKSDYNDKIKEHNDDKMEKKYPGYKEKQEREREYLERLSSPF